ncbi:MAG: virginiamycin B lyase family protein [Myxococcota bacterium]
MKRWMKQSGLMDAIRRASLVLLIAVSACCAIACGPASNDDPLGKVTERICSTASLATGNQAYQGVVGTDVTWQAVAGCAVGDTPAYEFWVQSPEGNWAIAQSYGPSSTFVWHTAGLAGGVYNFQVWIRAAGSAQPYEAWVGRAFVLEEPHGVCSGATLTAHLQGGKPLPADVPVGSVVQFSATSNCSSASEYEFWIQDPSGNWSVAQPWSTNAEFSWPTSLAWSEPVTPAGTGIFNFQVWVRSVGSVAAYEAYAGASVHLVIGCSRVSVTSEPFWDSATFSGDPVLLTATATCAGDAEYRFWIRPPGGTWSVYQEYGAAPQKYLFWDTTGLLAGDYEIQVWVRSRGSNLNYEAYAGMTFRLRARDACTGVTLSTPKAPLASDGSLLVQAGTKQTFYASTPAYCAPPEYQFVLTSGSGVVTTACAFSRSPTCEWDTTGTASGAYRLKVNIRRAGLLSVDASSNEALITVYDGVSSLCSEASITPSATAPLAGSTVAIDASVNCPAGAEYQFTSVDQAGTQTVVQDFSSSNRYLLRNVAGVTVIRAAYRNAGESASQGVLSTTISAANDESCSPPTFSIWPAVAPLGTPRTLSAHADCGAEYQFWVQPPGQGYRLLRDYQSLESLAWTTAGAQPGEYWFQVWARRAGSTKPYASYASLRVVLATDERFNFAPFFDESIVASPQGGLWITSHIPGNSLHQVVIRLDANGNARWFEERGPFPAGSYGPPTVASDGNLWSYGVRDLVRVDESGNFIRFPLPYDVEFGNIASAPNGLWTRGLERQLLFMSFTGVVSRVRVPLGFFGGSLAAGQDGAVWFSSPRANRIARLGPDRAYREFDLPSPNSSIYSRIPITMGSDANLWFIEQEARKLGRLRPDGQVTEFNIPNSTVPHALVATVGNLWIADVGTVYRSTLLGSLSTAATTQTGPYGIAGTIDGSIWALLGSQSGVERLVPPASLQ